MNCTVTKTFKTQTGEIIPVGRLLELTSDQVHKLQGFVMAMTDSDPPFDPSDPPFLTMAENVGKSPLLVNVPDKEELQTFESEGDSVSCRFWYQVCWAVGLYQDQCKRSAECRVYQFLEKQESRQDEQAVADWRGSAAKVRAMMEAQS